MLPRIDPLPTPSLIVQEENKQEAPEDQITDRLDEGGKREDDEDGRLRWYISKKKQEMEQAQWGGAAAGAGAGTGAAAQQNYFSNCWREDEEEAKTPSRDTFPSLPQGGDSLQQEPWSASQRPLEQTEGEEEDLDSDLNRYHEQLYEEEDLLHKEPEGGVGVGVGAGGLPPTVL